MSNKDNGKQSNYDIKVYSEIFRVLSNPIRLQIYLEFIEKYGVGKIYNCELRQANDGHCQFEMAQRLNIAPSTLSHHMKELKTIGLIKINRKGRHLTIEVDDRSIKLLKKFIG